MRVCLFVLVVGVLWNHQLNEVRRWLVVVGGGTGLRAR